MRLSLSIIVLTLSTSFIHAQSLGGENLAYLYDSKDEIEFKYKLVKQEDSVKIYYSIQTQNNQLLRLKWEERESYDQKQAKILRTDTLQSTAGTQMLGQQNVITKGKPWLLVLTIESSASEIIWNYPMMVENNLPINGKMRSNDKIVFEQYLQPGESYTVEGPVRVDSLYVYYYDKEFPSPFPPFSEGTGTVDPVMIPDSTYVISNHSQVSFSKSGLYLVQADTSKAEGFSFRINTSSFPKYTSIADLIGPLVYVSTQDEFKSLLETNGEKLKFDRIILNITKDKDRAVRFMRSYFQQVELANTYFSSYKEGWKTDQGMIYILFGLPDEIRQTDQTQLWYYKNSRTKFTFVRKGSIYDPYYYSLIRDAQYSELWYNTVDLWRKARF